MTSPRVSVIIIFLNEERFLSEAIASVRDQSFTDWELVLVDDGSTDASRTIARKAADGGKIRYLTHAGDENRGMSASRNAGLAAARGEFIAFLDADDVWPPEKLAQQVALFDSDPAIDMAYGRARIWHEWQAGAPVRDYHYDLGVEPDRTYPPRALLPVLIRNQAQTPIPSNAIMRRALVDRVGGFDDDFRGMFEDQVFFAKTHLVSHCRVDDRFWLDYRQHGESCTAQSSGRLGDLRARARFLRWLGRYLRVQRAMTPELRRELVAAWVSLAKQMAIYGARRLTGRI
ncbi:MAG: glycosyltransferase family 2 protein [Sphingobium sp.]